MTTPPGPDGKVNPSTLVAANEAGADEIYKAGGAQAIGALAYGTQSIPKVDKIVRRKYFCCPGKKSSLRTCEH